MSSWWPSPALRPHFQPLAHPFHCSGALPLSSFPALGFWPLAVASLFLQPLPQFFSWLLPISSGKFSQTGCHSYTPAPNPCFFFTTLSKIHLDIDQIIRPHRQKKISFLNKDTNPMITVLFTSVSPGLVQWCSTNITEWMNECFLSSSINFKINLCWDYVIIFLSLPRVLPRGFWLTDWSNLELWSH